MECCECNNGNMVEFQTNLYKCNACKFTVRVIGTDDTSIMLGEIDKKARPRTKEIADLLCKLTDKMLEIGQRCENVAGYSLTTKEVFTLAIEELKIGQRIK